MRSRYLFISLYLLTTMITANEVIFEALYEVCWQGWKCGEMRAILEKSGENTYQYTQDLQSSIFFFPFQQKEMSYFAFESDEMVPKKYVIERSGIDGRSYEIIFEHGLAKVHMPENSYAIPFPPYAHDKLMTQLVLVRDVCRHPQAGPRTIFFVDPDGLHTRTYHLDVDDSGYRFCSDFGSKSSAFTLSPDLKFIPTYFEQFRHGERFLTGSMVSHQFGQGWVDFVEKAQNSKEYPEIFTPSC